MIPRIFTLCRYASLHDGSMTVVDTFDRIQAENLPYREFFYLAAKFTPEENDYEHKEMRIKIFSLIEPTKTLFETKREFKCDTDCTEVNLIAEFRGLIFEKVGAYIFCIYLDDDKISEYQFDLVSKGE